MAVLASESMIVRAVQPILWIVVYGPIMSGVKAIPIGRVPYTDYITPMSYVVYAVRGLLITGELDSLPIDLLAIAFFDFIMFVPASLSFMRIIK